MVPDVPALDLFPEPVVVESTSREQLMQTNGLSYVKFVNCPISNLVVTFLQVMMTPTRSQLVGVPLCYPTLKTRGKTEMLNYQV